MGTETLRLGYFAGDSGDAAFMRRLTTLCDLGAQVTVFEFERSRDVPGRQETWETISLGSLKDGHYLRRVFRLGLALWIVARNRVRLRQNTHVFARNLDMVLLAMVSMRICRVKLPVIYEVLDIAKVLGSDGVDGRVARAIERWVLRRADRLVVSSQGFVESYFKPIQGYEGPVSLIENRLLLSQVNAQGTSQSRDSIVSAALLRRRPSAWRIGWFGTLRDENSFRILAEAAVILDGRLQVVLRGIPTAVGHEGLEHYLSVNTRFEGPYDSLRELPAIYQDVHLIWCADLDQGTLNERILLPNRLYESGYFAKPMIFSASTYRGQRAQELELGWALPEVSVEQLVSFISALTLETYNRVIEQIGRQPAELFVGDEQTVSLVSELRHNR